MMADKAPNVSHEFLGKVQPIVLVGGRSQRFGRDKLQEPVGADGRILVQYPIDALRKVFGRRVKLVGSCNPAITKWADGIMADYYPDFGPIGGILSALAQWHGPIFVLAGDMPCFGTDEILRVLTVAELQTTAPAILTFTDRLHPCAGVYNQHAELALRNSLSGGNRSLVKALDLNAIHQVPVRVESARNVNSPSDIDQLIR
ncbi:MAG: NTP transferase domain-containing protein [Phycisphaerae bacterium]|nr:NTP transferase domain-containing protein [Phycisphaerae bacterium]